MTSVQPLSKLVKVELKEAWPHEAFNFTPWLAEQENLDALGNELGLKLVFEAIEKAVENFSADILAKDVSTDRWVVIENQLEKTDHSHLGQVLTYTAGLDANMFIWIAKEFREPHRAAIDYLNRISAPEFSFFGVQMELYRIGDSPVAPVFRVVAQPNGWSKKIASDASGAAAASPQNQAWQRYWEGYFEAVAGAGHKIAASKPPREGWCRTQQLVGGDASVAVWAHKTGDVLRAVSWLQGVSSGEMFAELYARKGEIEAAVGQPLGWDPMDGKKSSIVFLSAPLAQFKNAQEEYAWLLSKTKLLSERLAPFCQDAAAVIAVNEEQLN